MLPFYSVSDFGHSLNPTPGKHSLRLLWKSDVAIDDGNVNHPPGVYEYVANFTVAQK